MKTIINKKFISDQSVTFVAPLKPTKYLENILKQADKDIKTGKNLSPLFTDMKEMDAYLARL